MFMSQDGNYLRLEENEPKRFKSRLVVLGASFLFYLSVSVGITPLWSKLHRARDGMEDNPSDQWKAFITEHLQRTMRSSSKLIISIDALDAQQADELTASKGLRADAKILFGEGKYAEALEKYERVKSILQSHSSRESIEMRTSCLLNAAACNLKLKSYDATIEDCGDVLKVDVNNVRAIFRRGQALEGKGLLKRAAADLKRAAELSPRDNTAKVTYETIRRKLAAEGVSETEIENARMQAEQVDKAAAKPSAFPTSFGAGAIPHSMKDMLTPEMMSKSSELLNKMSPAQMEQMQKLATMQFTNPGGITPEMQRMAKEMQSSLSPDVLSGMNDLAKAQGIDKMSPHQLEDYKTRWSNAASASGEYPFTTIKPSATVQEATEIRDMANAQAMPASADMLPNNVLPDWSEMMKTSQSMMNQTSGQLDFGEMSKMIEQIQKNPNIEKMMSDMFTKMTPEQLKAMYKQQGMDVSDEQVGSVANMFSNIKPWQIHGLITVAGYVQKGYAYYKYMRSFVGPKIVICTSIASIGFIGLLVLRSLDITFLS